jgi:retinol dehydrogenase-14
MSTMGQTHSGPIAGRTVLVTGGSGGIGKATALGLAAMGAHVAITGRDRERTESAAREIRAAGGAQVDVFVADMSAQAEVRRLADEVLQSLRIDVLINNAGGATGTAGTSRLTGSSAPSPSTISRRSCSPT